MANPRMTAEIGRVLGGRYRLVAPIGLGASAQVYLADDVTLRRRVAVKMLHDALAGDAEFLRRFRAEAQAAAALSHPHLIPVYDWGEEDVPFIVTEYLAGGSLRALLDGGHLLTPSQALLVGLEASRALDYAARRGFVHRDIKPANLLFGEDQRLRIADFGLARALAEAAWTEPQGAVLGTARYASPEQAKGEKLSGKADVYSLALVLVEAVTGEVPFVADTTLGTLMARVDRPLEVADELGPLQGVLTRAGHPDPAKRIDARMLATGLLRAAKSLGRPEPLPLAGALPPAGALVVDRDPTVHSDGDADAPGADLTADDLELDPPDWVNRSDAGRGAPSSDDAAAVVAALAGAAAAGGLATWPREDLDRDGDADLHGDAADDLDDEPPFDHADEPRDEDAEADPTDRADDADDPTDDADDADDPTDDADDPTDVIDLRGGTDVVPGDAPLWVDSDAGGSDPVDRVVDPAAALAPTAAMAAVGGHGEAGTAGGVTTLARPDLDRDDPQDPDGPDHTDRERKRRRRWPWIVVVLALIAGAGGVATAKALESDPPPPPARPVTLPVPELAGRTGDVAEQVARASGWDVELAPVRMDGTEAGKVIATEPQPGTRLDTGGAIRLIVSEGQQMKPLPTDLAGKPLEEAVAALEPLGLKGEQSATAHHEEIAPGAVISVAEGTPGELETGSTVGLVVSDGPAPRTVPSGLVGSTTAGAEAALADVQLRMAVVESYSDTVREGVIFSVNPRQGATVPRGATVTVEVSLGPPTVIVPDVSSADGLDEASAMLEAAGLIPGDVSGPAKGKPDRTRPRAGEEVRRGSTVNIALK